MMNKGNALINQFTIEELDARSGEYILEIGMGNGHFVKDILEKDPGIRYVGCDYSDIMIQEAMKRNEQFVASGQAKFFHGPGSELPFGTDTFDKVFTVNTIYFWDNPDLMLGEFRRVLKPGGKLLVSLRPETVMKHYPFIKYGFKTFSAGHVCAMLEANMFTVSNVAERTEPEQEVGDKKLEVASLVVSAVKGS